MQLIFRILNFYIFSNIHVAVGAFCFVKLTLLSVGVHENKTGLFVFFSTIVSYNFIRFVNIPANKNHVTNWFLKHKYLLIILSFFSGFCCLYFLSVFSWSALLVLGPFALLTILYGLPLRNKMKRLRMVPGLKIFVIAFCFAGVTVIFPLIQNEITMSQNVWLLFLQRFIFVILITIPFDIRDVKSDNKGLKTIPQFFGLKVAKIIGVFFGIIVVLLEYFYFFKTTSEFIIMLSVSVLSVILLLFSKKEQSRYYSAFWVESIPIVWYALLLISLNM